MPTVVVGEVDAVGTDARGEIRVQRGVEVPQLVLPAARILAPAQGPADALSGCLSLLQLLLDPRQSRGGVVLEYEPSPGQKLRRPERPGQRRPEIVGDGVVALPVADRRPLDGQSLAPQPGGQ